MRLLISTIMALAAAAAAPMAAAQDLATGVELRGMVNVDGVDVPLPDGVWTVYFVRIRSEGNYPRTDVGLMRLKGKLAQQMAYVTVARAARSDGFRPYGGCDLAYYTLDSPLIKSAPSDSLVA